MIKIMVYNRFGKADWKNENPEAPCVFLIRVKTQIIIVKLPTLLTYLTFILPVMLCSCFFHFHVVLIVMTFEMFLVDLHHILQCFALRFHFYWSAKTKEFTFHLDSNKVKMLKLIQQNFLRFLVLQTHICVHRVIHTYEMRERERFCL